MCILEIFGGFYIYSFLFFCFVFEGIDVCYFSVWDGGTLMNLIYSMDSAYYLFVVCLFFSSLQNACEESKGGQKEERKEDIRDGWQRNGGKMRNEDSVIRTYTKEAK